MNPDNNTSVLIVDANTDFTAGLSSQLKQWGYQVQVAATIDDLRNLLPDCDILLCGEFQPGDALKLLASVRQRYQELPIILLTSQYDVGVVTAAMRLWVSDCLDKQRLDADLLLQALARCTNLIERLQKARLYQQELVQANQELQASLEALRRDQLAGRYVQSKMLPESPMVIDGITLEHLVVPSMYLSGDFIDYMQVGDDKILFCIADVAGHGASSAFITVLLKHALAAQRSRYFRHGSEVIVDPQSLLQVLNNEIRALGLGKHVTLIVGCIDSDRNVLHYCLAGHLPPPVLCSEESCYFLEGGGPPIGLFPQPEFQSFQLALPEKWSISCFSDGVFDLLQAKSLSDCEQELLERCSHRLQTLSLLQEELEIVQVEEAPDDISILTIRNF